jgi:hypothetical protein
MRPGKLKEAHMSNALSRIFGVGAAALMLPACLLAQRYVISARPGALNYFVGSAFLNGKPLTQQQVGKTFIHTGDVVSTDLGKVEILLTPGVFLRLGANSELSAAALSLTDVQARLTKGELMLEVDELTKDNQLQVFVGSGSALIQEPGLYRAIAGSQPAFDVMLGKAEVSSGDRNVSLRKGHEALLANAIETRKFDAKQEDDLYAWSNSRSEYNSAASYQAAHSAWQSAGVPTGWGGYLGGYGLSAFGFGPWSTPGWYWNPMFSSWAWMPGADMAFFSPFGYGFFAPAVVGYAPVAYAYTNGGRWSGPYQGQRTWVPIAVNPAQPPARGAVPRSLAQDREQSTLAARSFAGFHTASGGYVPLGARMSPAGAGPRFSSRMSPAAGGFAGARYNGGHFGSWSRPGSLAGRSGWSGPSAGVATARGMSGTGAGAGTFRGAASASAAPAGGAHR